MKRAIYYDTETTGIKPEADRIIEIAAYDPVRNKTFNQLVNPQIPIPKDATAIHGITDEMVQKADSFAIVGKAFFEFCEGDVVLIAHNNDAFDSHFLTHEAKRHQLEIPPLTHLDSLKWARKYRPDLPKHALQYLRQIYGFEENQAHRALDDVIVLHQIFSVMTDDLTLENILSLMSGGSDEVVTMPFGKYVGKPLSEIPKDYFEWLKKEKVFDKPHNKQLKLALEKIHG